MGPLVGAVAAICAWLLAGVFATAAFVKLRDGAATMTAFTALRVPLAVPAARAVPLAEAGLAGLLLLEPRVGAMAAGAVLVGFTGFLARRLREGARVDCGCLGGISAAPLSAATLVRNGLLTCLALAAAAAPSSRPTLEAAVLISAAVAAGAVAHALIALRTQTGRLWDNKLTRGPGFADPQRRGPQGAGRALVVAGAQETRAGARKLRSAGGWPGAGGGRSAGNSRGSEKAAVRRGLGGRWWRDERRKPAPVQEASM